MRSAEGTCVLTVHRIRRTRERDHDLHPDSLTRLLDLVAGSGRPVTTDLSRPHGDRVALTFDDGTSDHLEVARLLHDRELAGVFFVTTGRIGRDGYLAEGDLAELKRLGHVVASHGVHHRTLEGLSPAELRTELVSSRRHLESIVEGPVRFFAAPGGSSHRLLAVELQTAGYAAARSMRWGFHCSESDRWHVPSFPVTELTLRSGWIAELVERRRIPRAMRLTGVARRVVPRRVAQDARRRIHARYR